MKRSTLAILALIAFVVASAVIDPTFAADKKKKTKKPPKGHPTYVFVDSTFAPQGTNRIAINFTNTSANVDALDGFFPFFDNALRAKKPGFILIDRYQLEGDAAEKGLAADLEALSRRWKQERKVDPEMLSRFSTELGLSYYLEGELKEWHSEQVEWNVEGYSHSEVSAEIRIFSGQTGKLVYEAHDRIEVKSQFHDPRAQTGVVDDLGIQRGGSKIVPPAPPINDVAEDVATSLVYGIP